MTRNRRDRSRKAAPPPADSPLPAEVAERADGAAGSVPPPAEGSRFWRGVVTAGKAAFGVALAVAASLAVVWGILRYVHSSPRFAIRKVEVSGAGRMTDRKIAELAGVKTGDNIFALDIEGAETKALEDPWIRKIRITRKLPDSVTIEVSEREAEAIAAIGPKMFLLTRGGEPFKEVDSGDPIDLPIVTGVTARGLATDRGREIERTATAMEVLRHYRRLKLSKVQPPQEVHVSSDGSVVLTVGKNGIALHLGKGPWRRKLLMAARVLGRLASKGRLPGIVFLDNEAHPERVVVRMR